MRNQVRNGGRLVLFPALLQGHMSPMLQLAHILYATGFEITIIHTEFNAPSYSSHPCFTFKSIPDGLSEPDHGDASLCIGYLIRNCSRPFRECLAALVAEAAITCVITDALWYFTQAVTHDMKLPRIVLRTSSLSSFLVYADLPRLLENGRFNQQDTDEETHVPEYPLMKVKDFVKISANPEGMADFTSNMIQQMKASSGIIWNSIKELEEPALETVCQDFQVPSFTIGPFHKYFPATSSSLIEQDRTILTWLDTQSPKSVIYVSFGSVARITESEFQEMAHGLANAGLPFLWVVRPGVVCGMEWLELLPETFLESVGDRGRIVKWCPQQEVLAHEATGCFWTHNGWNSTLESICEGVPMICSPCFVDQPINARYVSDVWKIGVMLEDGFERTGIEMAIKRVMMDKEGEEMRERINCLKEKVNRSVIEGGSSHHSLKRLVDYIMSLQL